LLKNNCSLHRTTAATRLRVALSKLAPVGRQLRVAAECYPKMCELKKKKSVFEGISNIPFNGD